MQLSVTSMRDSLPSSSSQGSFIVYPPQVFFPVFRPGVLDLLAIGDVGMGDEIPEDLHEASSCFHHRDGNVVSFFFRVHSSSPPPPMYSPSSSNHALLGRK